MLAGHLAEAGLRTLIPASPGARPEQLQRVSRPQAWNQP